MTIYSAWAVNHDPEIFLGESADREMLLKIVSGSPNWLIRADAGPYLVLRQGRGGDEIIGERETFGEAVELVPDNQRESERHRIVRKYPSEAARPKASIARKTIWERLSAEDL